MKKEYLIDMINCLLKNHMFRIYLRFYAKRKVWMFITLASSK